MGGVCVCAYFQIPNDNSAICLDGSVFFLCCVKSSFHISLRSTCLIKFSLSLLLLLLENCFLIPDLLGCCVLFAFFCLYPSPFPNNKYILCLYIFFCLFLNERLTFLFFHIFSIFFVFFLFPFVTFWHLHSLSPLSHIRSRIIFINS